MTGVTGVLDAWRARSSVGRCAARKAVPQLCPCRLPPVTMCDETRRETMGPPGPSSGALLAWRIAR